MNEIQAVVFSLNNQLCGIDTLQVQEIIKFQEGSKVPKMPKFVCGIINLRGTVIPVIDLNKRFELGQTAVNKKTKIVITKIADKPVGFIVNDVIEIVKFSNQNLELPPESITAGGNMYIKSVGKKGEKLISILDPVGILTGAEIKRLDKLEVNKS